MDTIVKTLMTANETTILFGDLDKPSLHALSYALRHPDTWPKGFYWDYSSCDHCAMGLAHCLWQSIPEANRKTGASIMAREFAIPFGISGRIFLGGDWCPMKPYSDGMLWWKESGHRSDFKSVTPEMVADQIDAYLGMAA